MTTILAFDTSGPFVAAALLHGETLHARTEEMSRGQAERLMPMIEEVMAMASTTWTDLDAIGVGIGPGNFTGIRISVATARGLALALRIPAVGVSALEAIAHDRPGETTVAVDARADRLYRQTFRDGTALNDPQLLLRSQAGEVIEAQPPIAAIAQIAATRHGDDLPRPAPLYIRPADAALPSEPPPRIIP